MAMLKKISGHTSLARVQKYLEEGSDDKSHSVRDYLEKGKGGKADRLLARDFLNMPFEDDQERWAEVMDRTRHAAGNDKPWKGKAAVTFQHIIISPDPKDGIDLPALREFVTEYCTRKFGDGGDAGELGCFQVAICYHDDNENHIPHAHIIVNNTDLETGRRLQINNKQNRALSDDLQAFCAERGMHHLEYVEKGGRVVSESVGADVPRREMPAQERVAAAKSAKRAGRAFHTTKGERRARERGKREGFTLWKDDIRNAISVAAGATETMEEWEHEMERLGYIVEKRDGDYLFRHPSSPDSRKVLGRTLGTDYMPKAIRSKQATSYFRRQLPPDGAGRFLTVESVLEFSADETWGMTLQDVADVVATVNSTKAKHFETIEREYRLAKNEAPRWNEGEPRRVELEERKRKLELTYKYSKRMGLFDFDLTDEEREQRRKERIEASLEVSIKRKVAEGARLTKAEYARLSNEQRQLLLKNQRERRKERERARNIDPGYEPSSSSGWGGSEPSRSETRSHTR